MKALKKKSTKKKAVSLRVSKTRKSKKKEATPEIIFDSTIGKTDALFVSNPDENIKADLPASSQLDPDIDEVLKEIDVLEKAQQVKPAQQLEKQQEQLVNPVLPKKKSFWKRFLKI
jgi:hypothetical protein